MAAVWGIDIGHTALKAVKLNRTREGLEISQVAYIPIDAGEDEESRPEQVRLAIKQFLGLHPIRNERVLVSLPGLHAFSRFIKLPPVEAKKVDEMVVYEAQQQIPFPIDEVMWGHHVVDPNPEPGEEIEVGIFATKKELILGFLHELKESGLSPDVVTIAPLAVLNFVSYNSEPDKPTVALDIGGKHTDLILLNGPKYWIRNLRIAGSDVTAALAERFKIPTPEAEKLKRQGSQSKNADKIFKSIERVLKDFAGEIRRSISFYKNQSEDDGEFKRMVLVGDGAKLKSIKPFFEKEMSYKVQRFSKLEQDKFVVGEEVDFDVLKAHILSFGVAIGLAVQGVGLGRTNLNLLPTEDQIVGELKRKVPAAAVTAGLCWLAVLVSWIYWTGVIAQLNETIRSSSSTANLLKDDVNARSAEDISDVEKKAAVYKDMLSGRMMPLELMSRLKSVLPQNNAEIVELSEDERKKSPATQADLINQRRSEKKLDEKKLWLLDYSMNRVADSSASEGDNAGGQATRDLKPGEPSGYRVNITVAGRIDGDDKVGTYNRIQRLVRDRIIQELGAKPFFVRKPGARRSNADNGEVLMGEGVTLYALDSGVRSQDVAGTSIFKCLSVELSFEVGFKPPPSAPEQPKEGG